MYTHISVFHIYVFCLPTLFKSRDIQPTFVEFYVTMCDSFSTTTKLLLSVAAGARQVQQIMSQPWTWWGWDIVSLLRVSLLTAAEAEKQPGKCCNWYLNLELGIKPSHDPLFTRNIQPFKHLQLLMISNYNLISTNFMSTIFDQIYMFGEVTLERCQHKCCKYRESAFMHLCMRGICEYIHILYIE